jgi:hypothetical protein
VTPNDFRRIALGMAGAVEGAHMSHPDFRANGRIFATISPDAKSGMVSLTPERQQEFMRADPETFVPAAGAWGRGGATMVRLATADPETVGEAMTLAWQRVMSAAKPQPKKRHRPAVKRVVRRSK